VVGATGEAWVAEGAEALSYRDLGITHGAHLRPVANYGDEVLAFDSLVGKDIGILMYFTSWQGVDSTGAAFDTYLINKINSEISDPSRRPVIMLSWQPLYGKISTGCDKDYPGVIPPANILNGDCDTYITNFANEIKARSPERYIIRFAHEMNITDSPWWPRHFGPTEDASLYVDMYQYVHDIFTNAGVDNAEWIWSPNWASNPPDAWNAIPNYYPGDAYVDWIGLSGYNWYNSPPPPDEPWRDFDYLYDGVLTDLTCRYAKPQIIAEVGSVEGTGGLTKADWISELYQKSLDYPFLRSIVWFNDYAQANPAYADFRVTTGTAVSGSVSQLPAATGAWTNAYSTAITDPVYNSIFPSLSAATPPHPICTELFLPIITR
jgi:hypothetical protein